MKSTSIRPGAQRAGRFALLLAAVAFLWAAPAAAATTAVAIDVEPRAIGLDDWAELSITVEGDGDGVPSIPSIDGLRFEYTGQGSRIESVNGRVRVARTYHLRVHPERLGTFHIDPRTFAVGSVAATGAPLELEVAATAPRPSATAARGGGPPYDAGEDAESAAHAEPFLRVAAEHERPFVGELVPIRIEAWFPEGIRASLDSLPKTAVTAFTLETPEGEGDVQRRLHEGRVYNVLTWHAALVGVKEGAYALPIEVEATLQVPDRRPRRRARRRSLLDDDFFGGGSLPSLLMDDPFFGDSLLDSFFGRTVEKPVTLKAELADFEVRPLPTEGRPEAFRGAVGSFELSLGSTPATAMAGDPITIETTVTGRGNFARVQAPVPAAAAGWKTYEADAEFEPADELGAIGRKCFQQTVVARDGSVATLPSLTFAYFDPLEERYEVLSTPSRPIRVDGTAPVAATPAVPTPATAAVPPRPVLHDGHAPRAPLVLRRTFQLGLAGAFAALGLGVALTMRRRRRALDPGRSDRRRTAQAVAAARADLESAYRASDSRQFFAAARQALQQGLAASWGCEPSSITAAEVGRRHPTWPHVIEIFATADAIQFGGRPIDDASLALWKERVAHALETVESA